MKNFEFFFTLIFLITTLVSCTEKINVDIPAKDDQLVIEGRVTNLNDFFSVKISKTQPINGGNNFPQVLNAFVTISDNVGNTDTLHTLPDFGGGYYTLNKKQGIVGRVYSMKVVVNGVTYTAQDSFMAPPILDSLYVNYLQGDGSINRPTDGYYLFYNFRDPPNEKNYYRYDIIYDDYPLDIKEAGVFDDRFLSPKVIGAKLPGVYALGDHVGINLYSLTKPAYDFYYGLSIQLRNDGGFLVHLLPMHLLIFQEEL
jgi:hypothetical protein